MVSPLTIYTATYNRAELLLRVYESLCRQTFSDFEWLIIDDGSTDNTEELVDSWLDEGIVKIKYYYKPNEGVHTARDYAFKNCHTELIMSCDSDDYLADDAVEQILDFWQRYGSAKYAGIFTPSINSQGQLVCSEFPKERTTATYQEFTYKLKCLGDKQTILRTEIVSSLPDFPVFRNERLVPEGYKWIQLPNDKPFLLMNDPVYIVEYQREGYSRNVAQSRFNNPNGFRESYREHYIHSKFRLPKFKGIIGYIAFSIILRDKKFLKNSPNAFLTLLFFPLGLGTYWYFWLQAKGVKSSGL